MVRAGPGSIVFVLAWFLRAPDPGEVVGIAAPKLAQTARSYTPREALGTPVFWLLYIMFVMVAASGLMATAQIAPIAKDFSVGDVVILFGASALSVALIVDNVCNGGRVLCSAGFQTRSAANTPWRSPSVWAE